MLSDLYIIFSIFHGTHKYFLFLLREKSPILKDCLILVSYLKHSFLTIRFYFSIVEKRTNFIDYQLFAMQLQKLLRKLRPYLCLWSYSLFCYESDVVCFRIRFFEQVFCSYGKFYLMYSMAIEIDFDQILISTSSLDVMRIQFLNTV